MAEQWVWRDGARLTPWMAYQIERLNDALFRNFGVRVIVSSGVRLEAEQEAIFRARYVTAGNVNGRRVYDTRWWNGVLWYRISPLGTVAAPNSPQANHQIQGSNGAVDIRDTGADAGVMTASSTRGRWIRAHAAEFDLVAEGDGFGEGWHFKVKNVWKTPPSDGGKNKEDGMTQSILLNGKHFYAIGEEFISHNATQAQADITRMVNSATDELHKLNTASFLDYLDGMGIPRNVVNTTTGQVLNPETGKLEANGVWSRRREAVAKSDEILAILKAPSKTGS